jgi:hypothetical protein
MYQLKIEEDKCSLTRAVVVTPPTRLDHGKLMNSQSSLLLSSSVSSQDNDRDANQDRQDGRRAHRRHSRYAGHFFERNERLMRTREAVTSRRRLDGTDF